MKTTILQKTLTGAMVALTTAALAVDRHVPTDYSTIQAAVNAAVSGDTIHIAPGIYVEQTWITNKNLTLIGQPGTILRAFPGMAPGRPGVVLESSIVFIGNASVVNIKGLCFEGDQLGGQNTYAMLGVIFDNSGGSVENCRFTGFRERIPGAVKGAAIVFRNGDVGASRYVAKVSGTTIADSYSGISIHGAVDVISYDVTVVDNTITGVGSTKAADPLEGITARDGVTGLVARNTVSGFAYDGAVGPQSHKPPYGILQRNSTFPDNTLPLAPMTFENNVLRDNQVHLASLAADGTIIRNNTFEDNVPLTESGFTQILEAAAGLWLAGPNAQVLGNQFRGLEQGIRLGARIYLGYAGNVTLIDNRFCDVARQIVSEPEASYTEQGTLTCPFPDPVLNIAKSVLLNWPKIEEGFVLECAPTPDGPWATVDAPQYQQGGNHAVAVPIEGGQKYFRLINP